MQAKDKWSKVRGEDYIWQRQNGYFVNVGADGEQLHASFPVSRYDSQDAALKAAKWDRDQKLAIQTAFKEMRANG